MQFLFRLSLFAFLTAYCIAAHGQNASYRIAEIELDNNKITRRNTILRELPFKIDDSISPSNIEQLTEEAKDNLNNTSLFNFIDIDHRIDHEKQEIVFSIRVEERWYIWPLVDILFEDRNLSSWLNESDIGRVTINGGARIENLMGLNNTLAVSGMFGFQKGFKASLSNIALDSERNQFIDVYFKAAYMRTENVNIEDNSPNYIKTLDRFMSESYMVGGSYTYRHNVRTRHRAYLEIENKRIDDTILTVNPHYWGNNATRRTNIVFGYGFQFDQRDYYRYPTKGYYVGATFRSYVTDRLDVYSLQAQTDLQYYQPLHKRWFASTRLKLGTSIRNTDAYMLDEAIGYNDVNLRGYELYVANGQHYVVSNNTLTYNILPKTIFTIPFMKWFPQFHKLHFTIYGRTFFDMGYASNKAPYAVSTISNRLLMSSGVGIDIATFYDIIFSIDYAFNREGTPGLFFQIRAPFM